MGSLIPTHLHPDEPYEVRDSTLIEDGEDWCRMTVLRVMSDRRRVFFLEVNGEVTKLDLDRFIGALLLLRAS